MTGRVLVLDNYDSFTYNLVQRLGELGADIRVFRNDKITPDEAEALRPEHLIISPGPCTPLEAGVSNDMIEHLAGKIPVLGVCRLNIDSVILPPELSLLVHAGRPRLGETALRQLLL